MKTTTAALTLISLFLISLGAPMAHQSLQQTNAFESSGRSTACSGDICINEVIPNPAGQDDGTYPNGEWFELTNGGTSDVDLSSWSVQTSAGKSLNFDSNTIVGYQQGNASSWTISPGEYMIIARNGNNNFYLTNTGMTLSLYDNNNNMVHEATWGGVASGKSYEQDSTNPTGNWIPTGSPSPGQVNTAGGPTVTIPSDLLITEVMANPWPSYDNDVWPGGEWVELMNTGTSDIDLTGWWLEDAAGTQLPFNTTHLVNATSNPSSYIISPGEHRIIAINGTSAYGVLNNGAETLTLKWPNGSASQEISWSSTVQGFALQPSAQPGGLWGYAPYPTPEGPNPMDIALMPRQVMEIQFTEIMSNATSDGSSFPDGEWIELHNSGTMDFDLMGWSIIDGLGNITHLDPGSLVFNSTQGSTMINAGERRLVEFTFDTQLWDDYNHLFLRDPSGQIVDTALYTTDYGEDIALVRGEQTTDPWSPAPWKTPGQPEPGSTPSSGTIQFSEILPDAVGADNQMWPLGEWLELHNYGTIDVDVGGWKLQAPSRSLTLHEYNMPLQSTSVIPAGDVALIALNGTSSFYLKHTSADSIGLMDMAGATVDTIAWSSTIEGESLIAPNSSHAGVGPDNAQATGDWIQSAWATPGELNPTWPAYSGPTSLNMTEIHPYCNDDSLTPTEDWVEFLNSGNDPVNLSRWSVLNADGERRFIRNGSLWSATSSAPSMTLDADERAVFLLDKWMLSGLGDSIDLLNPDGDSVDNAMWSIVTDCQTLVPGNTTQDEWRHSLWPTPGEEEPDIANFASPDEIRFTRFMPDGSTSISSNLEFIEISNTGTKLAVLNGWTMRSTSGAGVEYDTTITSMMIQPQSSVVLTNDADALGVYEDGALVDINDALNRSLYLTNSGAAIQLLDPSGGEVDAFVYGNGLVTIEGWNGISLVKPITNLDNVIYLRGSGCGDAPDSDTVADWHHRWSRLGGSTFCQGDTLQSTGTMTPLIGPENGLVDLLAWMEGATTTLDVHMYQLHDAHLVNALIAAQQRGVQVNVVLDYGDSWWNQYDLDTNRGMATTLLAAGASVYWFGDMGENPYAYIHSKVAVRDNESVWIGSGNWKSSSHPEPGERGNRDWGVLIEDSAFATMVQSHLGFDQDNTRSHITAVTAADAPAGWTFPASGAVFGNTTTSLTGDYEATLLVCPDNCIDAMVEMLDGAQEEILLSLQYLDMDWSYGWGENPIVSALEDAAERGIRLRLILNGAYLDEDIQSVVDKMNEDWNFTLGYDTAAIVMSSDDMVSKLHNKGAIIDGESVLVSSINWGDSALVRNREMGVLVTNEAFADVFVASWYEDWDRVDNITDSDQDRLLDAWEIEHGLHRHRRSVAGNVADESMLDNDEDGLSNFAEQLHGGDPMNADTDNDCIPDSLEVAWAQATTLDPSVVDINPRDALLLADADGDGVNEADALGCDLGGVVNVPDTTPEVNESADDDNDSILNGVDACPDTAQGAATDDKGCSSAQRAALVDQNVEGTSGEAGEAFFLSLMVGALILSGGAYVILRKLREEAEEVKDSLTEANFVEFTAPVAAAAEEWQQPVLNASGPHLTPEMMERVPGWTEDMVKQYLLQGWTMDQLAIYYQEQVAQHEP